MKRLKVRNIIILFEILIIMIGSVFVFSVHQKYLDKAREEKEEEENREIIQPKITTVSRVSLIMAGDALIHGAIYQCANNNGVYDFTGMISEIKPIVSKYDLAFYNQETILGGKEIGLSTYPRFNSPYEVGDAFIDAGFNLVSLANNHTLDRGSQAIINSRKYWNNQKNIIVSGSATSQEEKDKIIIGEKNGITYALIAYTTTTNGITRKNDYYVNWYSEEQAKKDIESVRDKVDVLMISMHWGTEYTHNYNSNQLKVAKYLSSLGVDIIIGTHPHVIQPIEYIGNTLVIYSLGNFISAQHGIDKLTGLMVSLDITKTISEDSTKIEIGNPTAELIYTYSKNATRYKVYPYTKLNDTLLTDYKKQYEYFMGIVTSKSDRVIPIKLED